MAGTGVGTVHVRLVFWDGFVGARPQVVASRDPDRATIRAALLVWQRLALRPRSDEDRRFLGSHQPPSQWEGAEAAQEWLDQAMMRLGEPVVVHAEARLNGDDSPWAPHDLTVGAHTTGDDLFEGTSVVAGFDQLEVERRLVKRLLHHDTAAVLQPVDINDPRSVSDWLDQARTRLPGAGFSVHQVSLPAAETTPTRPAPPAAEATVGVSGVWAAVFESESLGADDPQVWIGKDYDSVARAMVRLLADHIDPSGSTGWMADQRREFLEDHPVDLSDVDGLGAWLEAYDKRFDEPKVSLRQVYDAAEEQNLPQLPPRLLASPGHVRDTVNGMAVAGSSTGLVGELPDSPWKAAAGIRKPRSYDTGWLPAHQAGNPRPGLTL